MEQLDPVQVIGAAHRLGNIHVNHRGCSGVGLVNRQRTVLGQFSIQLVQFFQEEGRKAFPVLTDHHLTASLAPLLGNLEGVLAVVGFILQGKIIVGLETTA